MSDFIFFILLFISCVLGALTVKGIETLIKKKKAHRRYLKRLEAENKKLKQVVNFYWLELQTKGA